MPFFFNCDYISESSVKVLPLRLGLPLSSNTLSGLSSPAATLSAQDASAPIPDILIAAVAATAPSRFTASRREMLLDCPSIFLMI
jgi:hypothetical protein